MNTTISLPGYITRDKTCCFTGHRFIKSESRRRIADATDAFIRELYDSGYTYFIAGGAIGFDMLAELEVLRAAKYDPEIQLILALPCRDQTARWDYLPNYLELLRMYKYIMGRANHVIYTSDFYSDGCMKVRNAFMIDHSSACISYYNGFSHSGTAQTLSLAKLGDVKIYNICDSDYVADDEDDEIFF